ncbi:MAG: sulfotransferase [Pseudomonadota bacterium]
MAHPLIGADLATLSAVFGDAGRIGRRGQAAAIWGAALGRWPATTLERLWLSRRLPRLEEMPPPIFILGHWRSGTTHLYNVMVQGGFGYVPPLATGLPWDLFGIGALARPFLDRMLPEGRFIDNIPVTPTSPQEDEIALANMTPLSFYHGIYFPRRFRHHLARGLFFEDCTEAEVAGWRETFTYLMRKLALHQGAPLLIKNPVYTARVAMLREIFPGAKFIHIHRNPFDVFVSMRNFYRKLFPVMALQPWEEVDIDAAVLETYAEMMRRYREETAELAAPDFIEIAYADLDAAPMAALEQIYATLELPGFAEAAPRFEAYLSGVKSFKKNAFRRDAEVVEKVQRAWAPFIEHWGYPIPETA